MTSRVKQCLLVFAAFLMAHMLFFFQIDPQAIMSAGHSVWFYVPTWNGGELRLLQHWPKHIKVFESLRCHQVKWVISALSAFHKTKQATPGFICVTVWCSTDCLLYKVTTSFYICWPVHLNMWHFNSTCISSCYRLLLEPWGQTSKAIWHEHYCEYIWPGILGFSHKFGIWNTRQSFPSYRCPFIFPSSLT